MFDPTILGAPSDWGPHPLSRPFSIEATASEAGRAQIRFKGTSVGSIIFKFGDEGIVTNSGDEVRYGAGVRYVSGKVPPDLSWILYTTNDAGEITILQNHPASVYKLEFLDRQYYKHSGMPGSVNVGLAFEASAAFEFELDFSGVQFTKNRAFKHKAAKVDDNNALKRPEEYLSSRRRSFSLSGIGPLLPGGALYAEVGDIAEADHIALVVEQDFNVSLVVSSEGKTISRETLGELIPLHPFTVECEVNEEIGSITTWWSGSRHACEGIRLPSCVAVHVGRLGSRCAETYLTKANWSTTLPSNGSKSQPSLALAFYDSFHRPDSADFGAAETGQRWIKSKPQGAIEYAISDKSYRAVDGARRTFATYLKSNLSRPPTSMACVASFHGSARGSAVALIASTLGFPTPGKGGSNALHMVFGSDRTDYGLAIDGALVDTGASTTYKEPVQSGKPIGVGWVLLGNEMTLILPNGYFHRYVDDRFARANNRELVYELYKGMANSSEPILHAVSAF